MTRTVQSEQKVQMYNWEQNQLLGCLTDNKSELLLLANFFLKKYIKEIIHNVFKIKTKSIP